MSRHGIASEYSYINLVGALNSSLGAFNLVAEFIFEIEEIISGRPSQLRRLVPSFRVWP